MWGGGKQAEGWDETHKFKVIAADAIVATPANYEGPEFHST